jgi:RES domain-containing protein
VIEVYRLHSSRYPANSGKGAAIHGGRWNPQGVEAIYAAASRSLAILEILAHYSVLPKDFVMTPIRIPDRVSIFAMPEDDLPAGWDKPSTTAAQNAAALPFAANVVLTVPSAIVKNESIYVLNPAHPHFEYIEFLTSEPFQFDPRLKQT